MLVKGATCGQDTHHKKDKQKNPNVSKDGNIYILIKLHFRFFFFFWGGGGGGGLHTRTVNAIYLENGLMRNSICHK